MHPVNSQEFGNLFNSCGAIRCQGGQLRQWAKLRKVIKPLFTYCNSAGKRLKDVLLAPQQSIKQTDTRWGSDRCSARNHLTAEEGPTKDFYLFMDPWTRAGGKVLSQNGEKSRLSPSNKALEVPGTCLSHGPQNGGTWARIAAWRAGGKGWVPNCNSLQKTAVHWPGTGLAWGRQLTSSPIRPARQSLAMIYGGDWKIT